MSPIFRVTEHVATVIERSFDIEAHDEDAALSYLAEEPEECEEKCLVHKRALRRNREIVNVEEMK